MRSTCSICIPDPSNPDCRRCDDAPIASALHLHWGCGQLRSLPTREQELRARAEKAEAEVERQERRALDAEEKYRWMVEHAADQRLDGYRELGSRAACAENERDAAIAEVERLREECEKLRLQAACPYGMSKEDGCASRSGNWCVSARNHPYDRACVYRAKP